MGRAIVAGVVVVIVVVALLCWAAWVIRRRYRQEDARAGRPVKGDLTARQERQLVALVDDADRILAAIGDNTTVDHLDDPEVIRDSTRHSIGEWRDRYNRTKGKQ